MNNKEYATAMRQEAENWMDLILVSKETWLKIADRIEASSDPKGVEPFRGDQLYRNQ